MKARILLSRKLNIANSFDLKNIGLKATLPRLKILEIFNQANKHDTLPHHLTAEDIYQKLLKEKLDISLATIYRALSQFEQVGLLSKGNFESEKTMFELNSGVHHDHLICLDCGLIEEFMDEQIEERQKLIANQHGFLLQEHAFSIYGICNRLYCPNKKLRGI